MEPVSVADLQKDPSEFSLALMSHLSFFFGGWILALVMIFVTRGKSEYVRFQAIQAFAFQLIEMVVLFVYAMMVTIAAFVMVILADSGGIDDSLLSIGVIGGSIIHFVVLFGTIGTQFGLGIMGLVKASKGNDWSIPILGGLVFRRLFAGKRESDVQTQ